MKRLLFFLTFIVFVLACVFAAQVYVTRLAQAKADKALAGLRGKVQVTYEDLVVRLLTQDVLIDGVTISLKDGQRLTVNRITVEKLDVLNKKPEFFAATLQGVNIEVNRKNFGPEFQELIDLGYKSLLLDAYVDFVFDSKTNTLDLKDFRADIFNAGALTLKCRLGNFQPEALMRLEAENLVLDLIDFHYADQGIVKKLTQLASHGEETFVDFIVAGLNEEILKARSSGNTAAEQSLTSLAGFLRAPGGLTIDVVLKKSVQMGRVLQMKKISDILNLFAIRIMGGK